MDHQNNTSMNYSIDDATEDNDKYSLTNESPTTFIKHCIDEKFEGVIYSRLKEEILKDVRFMLNDNSVNNNENIAITSLKSLNDNLLSSIHFLREEIRQKNLIITSLISKLSIAEHNGKCLSNIRHQNMTSDTESKGNPSNSFNPFNNTEETKSDKSNDIKNENESHNNNSKENAKSLDKNITRRKKKSKRQRNANMEK